MAKTVIWKYILTLSGEPQEFHVPIDSKWLTVDIQDHDIVIWAECNVERDKEPRILQIYGTGNEIHEDEYRRHYIGTVQLDGYVWHIFEVFS